MPVRVNTPAPPPGMLVTGHFRKGPRYTTYRELGQATNPFVGGMVNNGFNYLDPRKISFTTTFSF